jgi:hypothetical protein
VPFGLRRWGGGSMLRASRQLKEHGIPGATPFATHCGSLSRDSRSKQWIFPLTVTSMLPHLGLRSYRLKCDGRLTRRPVRRTGSLPCCLLPADKTTHMTKFLTESICSIEPQYRCANSAVRTGTCTSRERVYRPKASIKNYDSKHNVSTNSDQME